MARAQRRQFHYIYKITNRLNGKFYIGMHSTDSLDDGYFGSGKYLKRSVEKHGKENHEMEILEHYSSREDLAAREKELVDKELLQNEMCMNIRLGGDGGGGWEHLIKDEKYYQTRSTNGKEHGSKNGSKSLKALTFEERSAHSKNMWEADRDSKLQNLKNFTSAAANSNQAKAKRKETLSKMKFQKGENNSQFGTCWINNGVEVKKIKKDELLVWLNQGWKQGSKEENYHAHD